GGSHVVRPCRRRRISSPLPLRLRRKRPDFNRSESAHGTPRSDFVGPALSHSIRPEPAIHSLVSTNGPSVIRRRPLRTRTLTVLQRLRAEIGSRGAVHVVGELHGGRPLDPQIALRRGCWIALPSPPGDGPANQPRPARLRRR